MQGLELRGPLMLLGADQLQARIGRETLVICGTPRGKTSLAAFAFHHLGFFLGERLGQENYEDQDVLDLIPPKRAPVGSLREADLRSLISRRNARHVRWGFKLPHSTDWLIELEPMLRNPVFMICLRNPLSVARTIMKRDAKFPGETLGEYLEVGLRPFLSVVPLMQSVKAPLILADMDEASVHPQGFVQQVARLFDLQGPIDGVAQSISVAGYKRRILTTPEVSTQKRAKAQSAAESIQRPRLQRSKLES